MNIRKNLIFVVSLALFLQGGASYGDENDYSTKGIIYFYNPESNINNYTSLKVSFDTQLARLGNFQFQPFDDKNLFEHAIESEKNGVFLLSSWHYRSLQKKLSIQPVLIGVSNGSSMQRKVLSANRQVTGLEQLEGKTIAVSGSRNYSESVLAQMFDRQQHSILSSIRLISVPKDIDALMAVGFGMATAALTTEKSLDNLKKINPKQHQSLGTLGLSEEFYLTLAVRPQGAPSQVETLFTIIKDMGNNPEGGNNLKMLGLDGWRTLTSSEQKALEN